LRKNGEITVMEPIRRRRSGAQNWERYAREAIGPAFGIPFDQATWNAGFVPKSPRILLLVTLAKEGMSDEHQ